MVGTRGSKGQRDLRFTQDFGQDRQFTPADWSSALSSSRIAAPAHERAPDLLKSDLLLRERRVNLSKAKARLHEPDDEQSATSRPVQAVPLSPGPTSMEGGTDSATTTSWHWLCGVVLSIASSFLCTLGLICQKLSLLRARPWIWYFGMALWVIGQLLMPVALVLAPISLLACLLPSSLVISSFLSPLLLGEHFTRLHVVSGLLIFCGCLVGVLCGRRQEENVRDMGPVAIAHKFTSPLFLCVLGTVLVLVWPEGRTIYREYILPWLFSTRSVDVVSTSGRVEKNALLTGRSCSQPGSVRTSPRHKEQPGPDSQRRQELSGEERRAADESATKATTTLTCYGSVPTSQKMRSVSTSTTSTLAPGSASMTRIEASSLRDFASGSSCSEDDSNGKRPHSPGRTLVDEQSPGACNANNEYQQSHTGTEVGHDAGHEKMNRANECGTEPGQHAEDAAPHLLKRTTNLRQLPLMVLSCACGALSVVFSKCLFGLLRYEQVAFSEGRPNLGAAWNLPASVILLLFLTGLVISCAILATMTVSLSMKYFASTTTITLDCGLGLVLQMLIGVTFFQEYLRFSYSSAAGTLGGAMLNLIGIAVISYLPEMKEGAEVKGK
ncbi:unnamed protein product [Amoebophrya sp. A120]|nr:unnamed protein product [Amoebophrya sp. A120]|eukprot:GSA120T00017960001.1